MNSKTYSILIYSTRYLVPYSEISNRFSFRFFREYFFTCVFYKLKCVLLLDGGSMGLTLVRDAAPFPLLPLFPLLQGGYAPELHAPPVNSRPRNENTRETQG